VQSREERYSRSMTPQLEEEEEDFVQETPEAALTAAQVKGHICRLEGGVNRRLKLLRKACTNAEIN
jgi:hypothetical protein